MIPFNLAAAIIAFREGLEAALIVGIVLSYLKRSGRPGLVPRAGLGVLGALVASALLALGLDRIGTTLEAPYEQLFEGTTMLLAVAVLTWMIFWMRYQARFMRRDLETRLQNAISGPASWSLAGLAFLVVFREGIETALFLAANAFAADGVGTLAGSLAGLALAAAVGLAIYVMALRINLHMFFQVTSIFLVLFAAGLLARAVGEYQEIGLLPMLTGTAWSTSAVLSNSSLLGSVLGSLVGYNADPTVLEVVGYVFYWLVVVLGVRWWTGRLGRQLVQQKVSAS